MYNDVPNRENFYTVDTVSIGAVRFNRYLPLTLSDIHTKMLVLLHVRLMIILCPEFNYYYLNLKIININIYPKRTLISALFITLELT